MKFYEPLKVPELTALFGDLKDLYLMINSASPTHWEQLECKSFDKGFTVFNIDKIDYARYPNIWNFRYDTHMGQFMSSSAFFTETDTRSSAEVKPLVEIHSHKQPVVINFPLINCTSSSWINFYSKDTIGDVSVSENGIPNPDPTKHYEPDDQYSSRDGLPVMLNSQQFHSVTNNGDCRRITAGWHMRMDVSWEKALDIMRNAY